MRPYPLHTSSQSYRKFEDTDRLLIEVALDNYEEIFNEWDPTPFKRRDIHPDLRSFFEECSSEISLHKPVAIAFFLQRGERDEEKEKRCIEGLRHFFSFNAYLSEKRLRRSYKYALKNFLTGVAFLSIAVTFESQFEKNVLTGILDQGLFIGGWVFAWEALSTVAFRNTAIKNNIAEWDRFLDAPIVFKKGTGQSE